MDPHSRDTRLHPRVPVQFPVVLVCSHMGKSRIEQARAMDLSPAGIGIKTDARLRLEQPISLEFTLPVESIPMKIEAYIRHNVDGRYGLQFSLLTLEQANLLKRMIN